MSNIQFKRVQFDTGCAVALIKTGRKYYQCVVIDYPIKIVKVKFSEATFTDLDYTVKKASRKFKAISKQHGITKGAKKIVHEAAA